MLLQSKYILFEYHNSLRINANASPRKNPIPQKYYIAAKLWLALGGFKVRGWMKSNYEALKF